MRRTLAFAATIVLVSAFLLYSLWFGWPGFEQGWVSPGDPRPRWFPTFSGSLVTTSCALFAFWLMRRWGSR